jgi:hypothetical protein
MTGRLQKVSFRNKGLDKKCGNYGEKVIYNRNVGLSLSFPQN